MDAVATVRGWNGEAPLELPDGDLWVFGYGSVMWRPGFDFLERHRARVHGYHRALCVWSWWHRGTPERPGLVLGLDRGGSCIGQAYRVAERDKDAVAAYLYERELVTPAYLARLIDVHVNGRRETALTFLVDRSHPQYAGRLTPEEAADTVRKARGASGENPDYVASTISHLREIGLRDHWLERTHALLCD